MNTGDGGLLEEELTEQIIGALIEVHRYWVPRLFEEIYEMPCQTSR